MSINVTKLELAMMQKINNASTELELLTYQKVLEQLRAGSVNTVSTYTDLPSYSENVGKLYFVEGEETVYWAGAGLGWIQLKYSVLNRMYVTGQGTYGRSGLNTTLNVSSPTQEVSLSANWCMAAVGYPTLSAIKTDGTLWGSGTRANFGGGGTGNVSSVVQEFYSATNWCRVTSGYRNTLAIKTDNTLWASGSNTYGDLGINSITNTCSFVQETSSSTNWCFVSGGRFVNIAIKSDGTLWGWGRNCAGSIGDNSVVFASSPVQEITSSTDWCYSSSGGYSSTLAIKTDGTLWGWGGSATGLGVGCTANRSSPVQEFCSATNWSQVSALSQTTRALKTDGTLWGAGAGSYGLPGLGCTTNTCSFVQEFTSSTDWCFIGDGTGTGGRHFAALKTNGTLWGLGYNLRGELGDGTVVCRSSPVQEITSATNWCYVVTGYSTTIAIESITL